MTKLFSFFSFFFALGFFILGLPLSAFADDTCAATGYPSVPCDYAGKTFDSYFWTEAYGNLIVYWSSTDEVVTVDFVEDDYFAVDDSTDSSSLILKASYGTFSLKNGLWAGGLSSFDYLLFQPSPGAPALCGSAYGVPYVTAPPSYSLCAPGAEYMDDLEYALEDDEYFWTWHCSDGELIQDECHSYIPAEFQGSDTDPFSDYDDVPSLIDDPRGFLDSLLHNLGVWLRWLLVPSDSFMSSALDSITSTLDVKFDFSSLSSIGETLEASAVPSSVTLPHFVAYGVDVPVINTSPLDEYMPTIRGWLALGLYFFTFLYVLRRVSVLIS
jgi:hypothetical protein